MRAVRLQGDGVAACCAAHLLERAGIPVVWERPSRAPVPVIMLGEQAIALLAEVFDRPDLFQSLPRVKTREVLWGSGATPIHLPHSGVIVSELELLASLRGTASSEVAAETECRLFTSRPLPKQVVEHDFGRRFAVATPVSVDDGGAPACWVEACKAAWMFLIGGGTGQGWLLVVGDEEGTALTESRLIAPRIRKLGEPSGRFPCFPRIVAPLWGCAAEQPWLACGTAALAFDPICGDGTATAVREAILAVAAIRAIYEGADPASAMRHFESRLIVGFQKHLIHCAQYYRTGGSHPWWQEQLTDIQRGIDWCAEQASRMPPYRYRLNGFRLEAIQPAEAVGIR